MVDITLLEVHFQDGSFSANLPFDGIGKSESDEEADDPDATAGDGGSGRGKGMALLGVLVFLILATAAVKHLSGDDDEPEVAIDTDEKSATVSA